MNINQQYTRIVETLGLGWTYVLVSPDFPWKAKVGYSYNFRLRIADIEQSMSSAYNRRIRIWCLFKAPMVFAKKSERVIHDSLFWRPTPMNGSGGTEWTKFFNPYCAALLLVYSLCSGSINFSGVMFLFFLPVAIDLVLFVAILSGLQIGAVALIIYCIWNTITNIVA